MIITSLQEVTKAKVKVFIDYEFAFVLYKGELRTYGICEEKELSEETYQHIFNEVLTKRARLRCMHLLKSRDYTRHGLEEKLRKDFYSEEIIERAVAYVISYGYVDDRRYARSYIGYAGKNKSRKQLEYDLLQKGVSKADIADAFEELKESEELESEENLIQAMLAKKHYDKENADVQERKKIIGFLYRKGFSMDKICKVLGDY